MNLEKLSDEKLINIAKLGNGKSDCALGYLYCRYFDRLYNFSVKILKNEQEAEDNVNDVFLKWFSNLDFYKNRDNGNFKAWIFKTTYNMAINKLRSSENIKSIPVSNYIPSNTDYTSDEFLEKFLDSYDSPEKIMIEEDNKKMVKESLKKLKGKKGTNYGVFLNMFYFQDKKYKEIQEELGVSLDNVKSRIKRAKKLLKKEFLKRDI